MDKNKKNLTKITLRGYLGKKLGKSEWNLSVKSVGEAIRAIDCLTKGVLTKLIYQYEKLQVRYKVVINGDVYENNEGIEDDLNNVKNSSLTIKRKLRTIEVIPVIEGSGALDALFMVIGIVLIAASFGAFGAVSGPWAAALFVSGAGLFGAGIVNLLSKPPDTGDIEPQARSYLFSGPANVIGEGQPVQVGYGRLRIGSHRVAASYKISYASDSSEVVDCY